MTPEKAAFAHRFEPAPNVGAPTLLLLHGTGGDENDLMEIGRALAPRAALLSPRGQVLENGMPRFFRRLSEGVFDENDLRLRAQELIDFIAASAENTTWTQIKLWRWAFLTAPTSPPRCCFCTRKYLQGRFCCVRWCR